MKRIHFIIICLVAIMFSCDQQKKTEQTATIIEGQIKNCPVPFGLIEFCSHISDHPDYSGFKSKTFEINENGEFSINVDNFSDGGVFKILIGKYRPGIILFSGDKLIIKGNYDSLDYALEFYGEGAGINNCNHLIGQYRGIIYSRDIRNKTGVEVRAYLVNILDQQQKIIDYAGGNLELMDDLIADSVIMDRIQKNKDLYCINEEEYQFLTKLNDVSYFVWYTGLIDKWGVEKEDTVTFDEDLFGKANEIIDNTKSLVNHFMFRHLYDDFYFYSLMKERINQGQIIQYKNLSDSARVLDEDVSTWKIQKLGKFYTGEILDYIVAEKVLGLYRKDELDTADKYLNEFKKICTNKKYTDYLEYYRNLLVNGLKDTIYDLSNNDRFLNDEKLNKLLVENEGKVVFITIWRSMLSYNFINEAPLLYKMQERYKDVKFLNICLDEEDMQKYWATQVIDKEWKGDHYFYPIDTINSKLYDFVPDKERACYNRCLYEHFTILGSSGQKLKEFSEFDLVEISNTLENINIEDKIKRNVQDRISYFLLNLRIFMG